MKTWQERFIEKFGSKSEDLPIPKHDVLGVPLYKKHTRDSWFKADAPPVLAFIESEIALAHSSGVEEERKRAVKIVRSHLLTDWSGEQEVYEQIEEIAYKVENPKKE